MWVKNLPDGGLGQFPAANWEPLMIVRVRLTTRLFPNNVPNPPFLLICMSSAAFCSSSAPAPGRTNRLVLDGAVRPAFRKTVCSHFHLMLKGVQGRGGARTAGLWDCYLHLCVTGRQRGPCQSLAAPPPWGRWRPRSWSKPAGIMVVGRREEGELLFHPQRRNPQRAGQV